MNDRIEPKKAERIFPFMEEMNKEDELNIYDENFIEDSAEDDVMSAEEECFMAGYLEA
ncbi:MAG: hypothetical protein ACLFTR_00675 [Candidatus Woesearchaeota archaeon]